MDHAGDLKAIYRFAMRTGCVAQPSWRMRIGLELMFFFFNKAIGKQAVDQQYDRMLGELTSASADARTEEKHA